MSQNFTFIEVQLRELRKLAFVAMVTTFIMAPKVKKSCFNHCMYYSDLSFVAFIILVLLKIYILNYTPEHRFQAKNRDT